MKKILFAALLLISSANFTIAEDQNQIKLGATLPLTGDLATYGLLIKEGVDLAVEDLQKEGIGVQVVYEDIPAPTAAIAAIKKLIEEDHIQGLVANFWNPTIPIMASSLTKHQIPTFHTAAADDLILAAGDYIVTTNTKIKDEAYHIAEYAYQILGARTANVLYIATTFGENYQKHFVQRFTDLGGKILLNDYVKLGDVDLKPILTRYRQRKADILFLGCFGTNLGLILKQADQVKVNQPVLSVYESEDPSVIEVAGQAAEGVKFFVPEASLDSLAYQDFAAKFKAKYNSDPRVLAANSYDATKIMVRSLVECKADSECVRNKFYQVKNYSGASGDFTIDAEGAASKNFALKTVKDGKFVRLN